MEQPVMTIEASVIDDDNLSKQQQAAIAFAAIQISKLLEVALAIGIAAGIDVEIKAKGELNNQLVMVLRTTERKENDNA